MRVIALRSATYLHIFTSHQTSPICHLFTTPSTRLRHTISNGAVGHGRVVAVTAVVVLGCFQQSLGVAQKRVELAPSVGAVSAIGVTDSERYGTLIEEEVDVLGDSTVGGAVGVGGVGPGGRDRHGGVDDLDVQASTEGLHVGDDHLLVYGWSGCRKELRELRETKSGEDASNTVCCQQLIRQGKACRAYLVSWLKSKYKVWLRGNETVLLSRVIWIARIRSLAQ